MYKIDRTGFGPGPWDSEPDSEVFECLGYTCLALRNPMGAWCGYISVPKWHIYFENDKLCEDNISVHGGVTYCEAAHETQWEFVGADAFLIGFDCAHYMDQVPTMNKLVLSIDGTYRTLGYVKEQCLRMAEQLQEADSQPSLAVKSFPDGRCIILPPD